MRGLTTEGKIVMFKSLAISKIVHLTLIKALPIFTIEQLNIIKKNFILQGKKTRKLYSYKNGGLKM